MLSAFSGRRADGVSKETARTMPGTSLPYETAV